MAHLTNDPAAKERWVMVYPAYLDACFTIPQGRRLPVAKAVERPTMRELLAAGIDLKLQAVVDGKKCYPRDFERPGRLRVQLKNSDGTPLREDVKTRDELYAVLAAKIKELPREQRKAEAEASRPEAAAGKADAGKKKGKK